MPEHLGHKGRNASVFTVDGVTDTLRGWAERLGCTYHSLYKRICLYGRSPEEAIRAGAKHLWRKPITVNGETHTIAEWGRKTGIDPDVISSRISQHGWSIAQALGFEPRETHERRLAYHGKTLNIAQWAKRLGIADGAMRQRLRRYKDGELSRRAVFMKGNLDPCRIVRKGKYQQWYCGKRLTKKEIAKRKGCSLNVIYQWLRAGYTATQILDNPALTPCYDTAEISRRSVAAFRRNKRLRELKRMGLMV